MKRLRCLLIAALAVVALIGAGMAATAQPVLTITRGSDSLTWCPTDSAHNYGKNSDTIVTGCSATQTVASCGIFFGCEVDCLVDLVDSNNIHGGGHNYLECTNVTSGQIGSSNANSLSVALSTDVNSYNLIGQYLNQYGQFVSGGTLHYAISCTITYSSHDTASCYGGAGVGDGWVTVGNPRIWQNSNYPAVGYPTWAAL